jgi:hypothetical protein
MTKTMVLMHFDSQGVMYNHYLPRKNCQLCLHCQNAARVPEAAENEKAHFGLWGVVPAMGQYSGPLCLADEELLA